MQNFASIEARTTQYPASANDVVWLVTHVRQLERALAYAKSLIGSYQLDIRASEWTGVNLVEKGFCQGTIYQEALETIGRIERGELIV